MKVSGARQQQQPPTGAGRRTRTACFQPEMATYAKDFVHSIKKAGIYAKTGRFQATDASPARSERDKLRHKEPKIFNYPSRHRNFHVRLTPNVTC
jgi:hypothetical protein